MAFSAAPDSAKAKSTPVAALSDLLPEEIIGDLQSVLALADTAALQMLYLMGALAWT